MSTETALLERWVWLNISLVIALLASALRWFLERPHLQKHLRLDAALIPYHAVWEIPWIIQPLRLLYAVGMPALALLWRGVLTPSGLGLKPLFRTTDQALSASPGNWDTWVRDLGWTCAFAGGFWILVALADRTARRFSAPRTTRRSLGVALREAVYHQAHWAFYREPFVLLLGVGMGAWAGLLPVAGEALLNPARWTDLQSPTHGRDLLIRAGLAVLSAMLFIQTQNIWLMLLADTWLAWLLGQKHETI
ncbi:MAG: hypothetical protein JXR84_22110 [Anaerolineae bacterium]|nr:hypothetical protein [Anaerolineae bacterium]